MLWIVHCKLLFFSFRIFFYKSKILIYSLFMIVIPLKRYCRMWMQVHDPMNSEWVFGQPSVFPLWITAFKVWLVFCLQWQILEILYSNLTHQYFNQAKSLAMVVNRRTVKGRPYFHDGGTAGIATFWAADLKSNVPNSLVDYRLVNFFCICIDNACRS